MSVVSKYNRIAAVYDLIEAPAEILLYGKWRGETLSGLKGRVLEVGVGTGRNLEYYSSNALVTGIDNSEGMLDKARKKAKGIQNITLYPMDAEHMDFPDNTFDYVVTTFVLCSIPDPVKALKEMRRVLKPSGELVAIEHMRSKSPLIARIEDLINPIMFFLIGDELTRNTVENIKKAGFTITEENNLAFKDVFKKIRAKP
jgi:demethylmenaquinone methyltransferase/2-methoxy-6-polyprenyl-1,4-benzoquinol methylase